MRLVSGITRENRSCLTATTRIEVKVCMILLLRDLSE